MIQIDNAVPMPTTYVDIESHSRNKKSDEVEIHIDTIVLLPSKAKAAKMDKGLRKIVDRYNEAHMKVYGMVANITFEKPWLRVSGIDSRVSRQRLLEMARQLEYRIGE